MTSYQSQGETSNPPERVLVVSSDGAFGERVVDALDRENRLVDHVTSTDDLSVRLEATRHDAVVVDHDRETVDAVAVVEQVHDIDADLPVVVCGGAADGAVASRALGAGAATFTLRDDAAAVAESTAAVVTANRDRGAAVDRAAMYRTIAEDVLGTAEVGFVVSDEEGTVRWVTDSVGELFGVRTGRLVGTSRRQLIRERLSEAVTDGSTLTGHLLAPSGGDGVLVRTDRLDTSRWVDCSSVPLEAGPFAGGRVDRFVDVTRFVREDDGLRELQRLMVSPGVTFAERLHAVLELGSDRLGLPYGFVTAIDDGVQSVLDSVGDHELLQPGKSAPMLQTYCRKTLAADSLVAIPDAPAEGWSNDPAYETFELDSYIGAPVLIDGENYGTLCFASSDGRGEFTGDEELFVEFAAAWTGWELERYGPTSS